MGSEFPVAMRLKRRARLGTNPLLSMPSSGPGTAKRFSRPGKEESYTPMAISSGTMGSKVPLPAKSGSWLRVVRNEVGVAEYPDGRRYALAVFTRTTAPHTRRPDVDRAIGEAARAAVEQLR